MKPIFKITAGNDDITSKIRSRLLSINISDETGLVSDKAEITLDDSEDILQIPPRGTELEIALGYETSGLVKMGRYVVDELSFSSPPQQMRISAKTSNAKMRRAFSKMTAPKSFSWHEYLLQDIVFAIATLNGFDQAMVDKSLQGIFIKHLDQSNESDIALLQRLAQDLGAFIKAVDNVLIFSHRRRAVSVTGKPMPQTNLTRQDITSYNMTIAERGKYGKVIAKWHDFTSGEEMKVEAGQAEPAFTIRHTFANKQRAKLAVNARLEEFTHGSQSLELAIIGNPNITAESLVNLQGLSHKINGKWVVMSITHDFTNSGYTCDLSCQKPVDVTPLLKGE